LPIPEIAEIEEFAKVLMRQVRDTAIQNCDMLLRPVGESPTAKRWRAAQRTGSPEVLAKEMIPDVVDTTLWYLLHAIDEGVLRLLYTSQNGKLVDLGAEDLDGLAGWLGGGRDGWTKKYSQERFVDDLAHLDNFFQNNDKRE
jgi:hypothetical protein